MNTNATNGNATHEASRVARVGKASIMSRNTSQSQDASQDANVVAQDASAQDARADEIMSAEDVAAHFNMSGKAFRSRVRRALGGTLQSRGAASGARYAFRRGDLDKIAALIGATSGATRVAIEFDADGKVIAQ